MIVFELAELEWILKLQEEMKCGGYFFEKKEFDAALDTCIKDHCDKLVDMKWIKIDSIV